MFLCGPGDHIAVGIKNLTARRGDTAGMERPDSDIAEFVKGVVHVRTFFVGVFTVEAIDAASVGSGPEGAIPVEEGSQKFW